MTPRKRAVFLALCLVAGAAFLALGIWQVQRLAWKVDLIARVESRVHAEPVAPPSAVEWSTALPKDMEYRRLRLHGRFLHDRATRVDALTERGAGVWLFTPLVAPSGTVLVNRGFEPRDRVDDESQPSGDVEIVGLLRLTEPGGRFLRPNQPAQERWFSRDVAAIASARGLHDAAPFFVDAERSANGTFPIGGLTVVDFRNAHAVYALTWFALAGVCGFGAWRVLMDRRAAVSGPVSTASR